MRPLVLLLLPIASLGLSGCGGALRSQQPPVKWSAGFWLWQGAPAQTSDLSQPVDVLFFQVGSINQVERINPVGSINHQSRGPTVYATLPEELPPAREYWMVLRFDHQGVPDISSAAQVASKVYELQALAQQRHWNVAGIQLDIDSPTRLLPEYAKYLAEVRKHLPSGFGLSITALLDWFREGTSIAGVIKEVDEFVPQFYDVSDSGGYSRSAAIEARFDGAKWGPIFNRFGKRFRLGISSFGRAIPAPRPAPSGGGYPGFAGYFADATPIDLGVNPAFKLDTSRNDAHELILTYRAVRKTSIGYSKFEPGDGIQFILPTSDSIKAAVESAHQIGGYCAGVLFFRWPTAYETLAMRPDEVLAAAGASPSLSKQSDRIQIVDGACAAVKCVDVYLVNANPLRAAPTRYRIRASKELEYFLPQEGTPIRMTGPLDLTLSLPPYGGRRRMYLGRAVSLTPAEFTIQEQP